jgi:predicted signal transduction protein with EAL and GGDEF domain
LIEHADIALYQAKARGRARAELFAETMKADLLARRALAGGDALRACKSIAPRDEGRVGA